MKYIKEYNSFSRLPDIEKDILVDLTDNGIGYYLEDNCIMISEFRKVDKSIINEIVNKLESFFEVKVCLFDDGIVYFEKGIFNKIKSEILNIYSNLKVLNCDVFAQGKKEYIYYNNNKQFVFHYNSITKLLRCNHNLYSEKMISKFDINSIELEAITKHTFEEILKLDGVLRLISIQNSALDDIPYTLRTHIGI